MINNNKDNTILLVCDFCGTPIIHLFEMKILAIDEKTQITYNKSYGLCENCANHIKNYVDRGGKNV